MSSTQTSTAAPQASYKGIYLSKFPIASVSEQVQAVAKPAPTGVDLYARFAIAGAVCCSITHGGLTPVDVVKTRIQLEPEVYNKARIFSLFFSKFFASRSARSCSDKSQRSFSCATSPFGLAFVFRIMRYRA